MEELARQNNVNLHKSGIPNRVEKTEKKLDKMDSRLTSTQTRAVAEAVSIVIQNLVKVGCLRQGRSAGAPDLQFEYLVRHIFPIIPLPYICSSLSLSACGHTTLYMQLSLFSF